MGRVSGLFPWHANADNNPYDIYNQEFKRKYRSAQNFDYIVAHRAVEMLARAVVDAHSDDPLKVAYALEGMSSDGPEGHAVIRAEDHQMIVPLYLAKLVKVGDAGPKFDVEGTGLGWKTVTKAESKDMVPPLKCRIDRPAP